MTPEPVAGCVFCAIATRSLPSDIVADGEHAIVFRDINPLAPIHLLVVPRQHIEDAAALGAEHGDLLAEMFALANEAAARAGVAEGGYRLVMNVGHDSGNTVSHLHLHVLGGHELGGFA